MSYTGAGKVRVLVVSEAEELSRKYCFPFFISRKESSCVILGIVFGAAEALIIAFVALSPAGALHKATSVIHAAAATSPGIGWIIDQTQSFVLNSLAGIQHLHF